MITANRIYTFTSGFIGSSLKMSNDNGETKNELLNLFANKFTAVATFPSAPQTILTAFGGFDPSETQLKQIDFSDMNNISVTDINLPVQDYIYEILIDDSGKITVPIGVEVFSSTDGGATWTNSSDGLEVLTVNDLIFDLQKDPLNANRMALASSKGIFISEDGGLNWNRKTNTLVFNVAFSTETEGAMTASTYSSQLSEFALHYSIDSGENWDTISNEQLLGIGASSSAYLFNENSVKVFIGTYDLGLVEYTIELNVAGAPDFINGSAISIFPNPTSDILNISLQSNNIKQITVYSISGAQVMTAEDTSELDISRLSSGIYLVRVMDEKKGVFFKRILKQ